MGLTYETVLEELGDCGRFQNRRVLHLQLVAVVVAITGLSSIFSLYTVQHSCDIPARHREPYASLPPTQWSALAYPDDTGCSMYDPSHYDSNATSFDFARGKVQCEDFVIQHTDVKTTATADFLLICDRESLKNTANSIFFVGVAVGLVVCGQLGDAIGRKPVMIVQLVLLIIVTALTAFTWDYPSFLFARFCSGFCYVGGYLMAFTIICEMYTTRKLAALGLAYEASFGTGLGILAGIAYFVRDWRTLQLVAAACAIPSLLLTIWAPESLRWLLSTGRYNRAFELSRKIAKINKNPFSLSVQERIFTLSKGSREDVSERESQWLTIIRVFKTPGLRSRVCILSLCWFVVSCVYYGLSLGGDLLPGSIYVNTAIGGLVEVPAMLIAYPIAKKVGRKPLLVGSFILGGISCSLLAATFSVSDLATQSLAQFGKFCITMSFGILYVFTFELLPTRARTTAMAFCSVWARIGSVGTPYIMLLSSRVWPPLGFVCYGVLALSAGLVALSLPETLNMPLQDSYEDAELFGTAKYLSIKTDGNERLAQITLDIPDAASYETAM